MKSKSAIVMESYKQVRNRVNSSNKQLKKEYFTNKISSCKGNIKDSWRTMNELLTKRSKSSNIDILKGSDSETGHKKGIPGGMNSYFNSIGKERADKISIVSNPLLSGSVAVNKTNAKFQFKAIQVQKIRALCRDALAKVKTTKGFGVDNISSFFPNLALPFVENSLTLLFNTSIETSIFLELWKIARVTLFFKDGDRADKSNYRPISLLPVIARLFQKLVANQLYQHAIDIGLLSPAQSAYRHLHSTVTHLLKNTNDWYSGLDRGKLVGLTFIGHKKTFDNATDNDLMQLDT